MGFLLEFDARNNILRLTLEGRVTNATLLDAYAMASRYVASHVPCRGIGDVSLVTKFEASINTARQLALRAPVVPPGYTRVFVAPQDAVYGMGEDSRRSANRPGLISTWFARWTRLTGCCAWNRPSSVQ